MATFGEVAWVLATAPGIGLFLGGLTAIFAWAARMDQRAEPEEPAEWDKLAEHERDFLRSWAKHRK